MTKKKYWTSSESMKYQDFNIALPSERVAYAMTYLLADVLGKEVLDVGCFQGNSSSIILSRGARSVTGFDAFKDNIVIAKEKYALEDRLDFLHVDKDASFPTKEQFDVATMTFVHPVISDIVDLEKLFDKTHYALKDGAKIVLLGLGTDSFKPVYDFCSYDFNKLITGPIEDGDEFRNKLYLQDGILDLKDFYWSDKTLESTLEKRGFRIYDSLSLGASPLSSPMQGQFETLVDAVAKESGMAWKDEWTAPLYKIIIAEKFTS